MKHEQQKRKTRDVSSNEPEIATTAWKVPFLSSFVHEARTTEKEHQTETFPPTNPKQPQLPGKCLFCLRSFMKHGQLKRKTRDVSSNEPETAATAWKVPKVSSFVNDARTTEMEDREASLNEPENAANPRKMLKMSSFIAEARETEMEKLRETTSPNAPNPAKTAAEHAVLCTAGLAILSCFYSIRNRTEPIPSY